MGICVGVGLEPSQQETKPELRMTTREIKAIEEVLHRRNQAEIKVEQGKIAVIEIKRKKVN